jgi:hypothetical protein
MATATTPMSEVSTRLLGFVSAVLIASVLGMSCGNAADNSEQDPPVKKSAAGICYAPESDAYPDTEEFKPYDTLEDCVISGGRLPDQAQAPQDQKVHDRDLP